MLSGSRFVGFFGAFMRFRCSAASIPERRVLRRWAHVRGVLGWGLACVCFEIGNLSHAARVVRPGSMRSRDAGRPRFAMGGPAWREAHAFLGAAAVGQYSVWAS